MSHRVLRRFEATDEPISDVSVANDSASDMPSVFEKLICRETLSTTNCQAANAVTLAASMVVASIVHDAKRLPLQNRASPIAYRLRERPDQDDDC